MALQFMEDSFLFYATKLSLIDVPIPDRFDPICDIKKKTTPWESPVVTVFPSVGLSYFLILNSATFPLPSSTIIK